MIDDTKFQFQFQFQKRNLVRLVTSSINYSASVIFRLARFFWFSSQAMQASIFVYMHAESSPFANELDSFAINLLS